MKVYNKRHGDAPVDAVYVGRPTMFGNPFSHLANGTLAQHHVKNREEAVRRFEEYLLANPSLLQEAKEQLRGKSLVCWCAPKSCHADVLMKYANM